MTNNHFKGHSLSYCSQQHRDAHKHVCNELKFILHLQENLPERFPDNELSLIEAMDKIFSLCRYPNNDRDLNKYGEDALELLSDHYGLEKNEDDCYWLHPSSECFYQFQKEEEK